MFDATYLGWQGWMLGTARTRMLVDPLLVDDVGRGPVDRRSSQLFPRRRSFAWNRFPAVNAVFITHEHEDHFSLRSLACLERAIPIYLSARSSMAARRILDEMGFRVSLVEAGATFRVGDLNWWAATPDHLAVDLCDEWDTLAYCFWDDAHHGAFFSPVDVYRTRSMNERVGAVVADRRTGAGAELLCFEEMAVALWAPDQRGSKSLAEMHRLDKSRLEYDSSEEACGALRRKEWVHFRPGQCAKMANGRVEAVETSPLIELGNPVAFGAGRALAISLDDDVLADIASGLQEMATFIYGSRIFKALYSQEARSLGGRKPTFVLMLATGEEGEYFAFEYEPSACAFVDAAPTVPAEEYAGVVEMSAADFARLVRGEFEPRALIGTVRQSWEISGVSFERDVLWPLFHPLRRPQACLQQYRKQLAAESEREPPVRFSSQAGGT